jgi:hypothetical protein
MMRRVETNTVRAVMQINVEGKRKRRLKKRWLDTIENYVRAIGVCEGDIENRNK